LPPYNNSPEIEKELKNNLTSYQERLHTPACVVSQTIVLGQYILHRNKDTIMICSKAFLGHYHRKFLSADVTKTFAMLSFMAHSWENCLAGTASLVKKLINSPQIDAECRPHCYEYLPT
jgi:hypothetical protein